MRWRNFRKVLSHFAFVFRQIMPSKKQLWDNRLLLSVVIYYENKIFISLCQFFSLFVCQFWLRQLWQLSQLTPYLTSNLVLWLFAMKWRQLMMVQVRPLHNYTFFHVIRVFIIFKLKKLVPIPQELLFSISERLSWCLCQTLRNWNLSKIPMQLNRVSE